ncbi:MAG: hypothetical protein ACHP9V_03440 [Terriglobales bacterium]
MKDRDASRHPGPFRIMQVDSEIAGLLVAVGFLVMGFVSMPIATGFVLGAIALGVIVALALRFTPKKFTRVVLGTAIILAAVLLWWEGHNPRRPRTVPYNALYLLPNNVPFTLHKTGYWLDCWFDEHANVDRCKLTDENGTVSFEDAFLPCVGQTPLPQSQMVFNAKWTGYIWTRSPDKTINVPVVHLENGQVLLPQSFYAEAKRDASCSPS